MRAAVISTAGERKSLSLEDVPEPSAGPGQIVVAVRAAALNRADLALNPNHRRTVPRQHKPIAGQEFAGEVVTVGEGVDRWSLGDRVMGMTAGAFAERCRIDQRLAMPVPDGLPWEKAATLPVALQTMHDAIVTNGRLRAGETVLIQGASSGVGIAGMQIAKLTGASLVIGSSRSDQKIADLKRHGMDEGVNVSAPDWPDRVLELTGGRGVDLVIDMVSGDSVNGSMHAAAVLGRIVNVGRLGGMSGPFEFDLHALKRLSYIGVTFRTRSDEEIAAIIDAAISDLWEHVAAGRIAIPVTASYALSEVEQAYDFMRSDRHSGKIILLP